MATSSTIEPWILYCDIALGVVDANSLSGQGKPFGDHLAATPLFVSMNISLASETPPVISPIAPTVTNLLTEHQPL